MEGIAFSLLILILMPFAYNVVTLDSMGRQLSFRHGFKQEHLGYDEMASLEQFQYGFERTSYIVRAVLKTGVLVVIASRLRKNDAVFLSNLIDKRRCSK